MSLVKEIILSLVSCLVVLIALSIGFYRFIPNNKVIPETVSYQASEEIKNELNSEVETNSESIVKTENEELKQKNSELEKSLREFEVMKTENEQLKQQLNLAEKQRICGQK